MSDPKLEEIRERLIIELMAGNYQISTGGQTWELHIDAALREAVEAAVRQEREALRAIAWQNGCIPCRDDIIEAFDARSRPEEPKK